MSLSLEHISKEDWSKISESVHKYSFSSERPAENDRISYALLVKKNAELSCFSTIIELDADSAYMQHGGNFKESEGQVTTLRGYLMMINYLKEAYKNISTRIMNKNKPMLKLAWAAGFLITGLDVDKFGNIFLIHELERN